MKCMLRVLVWLSLAGVAFAQENPSWSRPFPPHKIAGNVYYVGTEDLACFLLTTPEGHILINTGLAGSAPLIRASIQKLGFRVEDVKILLTMQAHFDHVGAMKEIQRVSGAKVYATGADAAALEHGGRFAVVKVDRRLMDGEVIRLGGTGLRVILTPGHTKGSVTYSTTVLDGGVRRSIVFANMGTVVSKLVGNSEFPQIAEDFERSFEKQKQLSPDIWVAAHASQYGMAEKLKAGSFVDPQGYKAAIERYEKAFREELEKERKR
jgi:metallo-beta-lactamase class B